MLRHSLSRILLLSLTALGASTACNSNGRRAGASETLTDLGAEGNQAVADRFNAYRQKRSTENGGCRPATSAKRVMITGFGLFTGVDYNISGVVAQSFADQAFTPEDLALNGSDAIGGSGSVGAGRIPESALGAVTTVRHMTIRGEEYEVCVLTLDVLWDLAAAIITLEAESFQPSMIIMSGRGASQAIVEAGALNDAQVGLEGYDASGSIDSVNAPVASPILLGRPTESRMTWNGAALAFAARPVVQSLGFTIGAASGPRRDNNYICNNVSYVVLEAARGAHLSLAGGLIAWSPAIQSDPKIGFFHYPGTATHDRAKVAGWVRVLATFIATELGST